MQIINKLKSQRGASFIIAMVYFLICVMVGGTMITAASVDRGRAAATIAEQNSYFAVQSAALLFRDEILNATFEDDFEYYGVGTGNGAEYEEQDVTYEYDADGNRIEAAVKDLPNMKFRITDPEDPDYESIHDPKLKSTLEDDEFAAIYGTIAKFCRDIFYRRLPGTADTTVYGGFGPFATHDLECELTLEGSDMPIKVKLIVTDDYKLQAEFRNIIDPSNTDNPLKNKEYCVSLYFTPSVSETSSDGTPTGSPDGSRRVIYVVSHPVTNPETGVTDIVEEEKYIDIEYSTVTVTWGRADLRRGPLLTE